MSDQHDESLSEERDDLESRSSTAPEDMVTCHECESLVPSSHRFCGHCGASLVRSTTDSKQWTLSLLDVEGDVDSVTALIPGTQVIGSAPEADIRIEGDRAVSPRHVLVRLRDGELSLEDKGTRNGLFEPITTACDIAHNALIRAGGQLFRFQLIERLGVEPVVPLPHPSFGPATRVWGRLLRYNRHGQVAAARLLDSPAFRVGRRVGDWQMGKARTMSGEHFELLRAPEGVVTISDLNSRNGTFVQINGAVQITNKSAYLIGDRLIRLDQVTLTEYHEAISAAEDLEIQEAESVDAADINQEETFVAIPEDVVEAALEDSIPPIFANESEPLRPAPASPAPTAEHTALSGAPAPAEPSGAEPEATITSESREPEPSLDSAVDPGTDEGLDHPTELDEAPPEEEAAQVKEMPEPKVESVAQELSAPNDLSEYATEIDDEEPGEWAKAALSDFQDVD